VEKRFRSGRANLRVLFQRSKSEAISSSANTRTQETSVILYAYLATGQKVRNGCDHFSAAFRARVDCQDQIAQRKPAARPDDLANVVMSFHVLTISGLSRSDATGHCEYVFHRHSSGYSVVINFRTDRWATLLFNFRTSEFNRPRQWGQIKVSRQFTDHDAREVGCADKSAR
jgi:hypothetical protein